MKTLQTFGLCLLIATGWLTPKTATAAEADEKPGQLIVVHGPITPNEVSRVQRAVRQVLEEQVRQGQRPTLVFEIQPGASEYADCLKLADFLRNEVRAAAENTIAYVPEALAGHAVMVALACRELVMHPDAAIGDIGRHESGTPGGAQRTLYKELADDRHWPAALVLGMLDRELEVLEIKTAMGARFVLREELDAVRDELDVNAARTFKPAGEPLLLSASLCRTLSLAKLLARDRAELAGQYHLGRQAMVEDPTMGVEPNAVVIRVDGVIDPILQRVVSNAIARAQSQGRNLLIFRIDSPGGMMQPSFDIAHQIKDLVNVRTVAYVPRGAQALSGAAFVALACDEIYMHPEVMLGDAGPIEFRQGQFEHVEEKWVSPIAGQLGDIAEAKGRPRALAEAMVDRHLVVHAVRNKKTNVETFLSEKQIKESADPGDWQILRTVTQEGRFLTVNGSKAKELRLADAVVSSDEAFFNALGLDAAPPELKRTFVDSLVYYLNTDAAAFLLVFLGVLLLFVELNVPGISIAGIGAMVCFLLFFWGRFLGGTAGWLEVVLFLSGLGLIGLELFVLPGFGVTGVAGIVLLLLSVVFASQTFYLPTSSYQWHLTLHSAGILAGALMSFLIAAVILSRYLPSVPFLGRIILQPPRQEDVRPGTSTLASAPARGAGAASAWLGRDGVTITDLRPAGKARLGDELADVVADGYFIPEGSRVRVIDVTGNRVVVKQV